MSQIKPKSAGGQRINEYHGSDENHKSITIEDWYFSNERGKANNSLLFEKEVDEFQKKQEGNHGLNDNFMKMVSFFKSKLFLVAAIFFVLVFVIVVVLKSV